LGSSSSTIPQVRRFPILVLAGILSSCALAAPTATTIPSSFDLTDPPLLARLGSPPIEDVVWERTVDDFTVVGSTPHADPSQLELLAAALEEVPEVLLEAAPPREFVRIDSVVGEEQVGKAVAFTSGPDVYLVDRTFNPHGHGTTRLDLARALAHELTHVAQFRTLDPSYVAAVLDGELGRVDPANGSDLVREFAAKTGWSDTSSDPLHASWHLDGPAATDYGATGPAEDMAESVAMVAMGRANWIPDDHTAWVEQWLGTSAERLALGKPWIPAGSAEVITSQTLYDEAAVATAAPGAAHREAHYFELPVDIENYLALGPDIEHALLQRGLSGTLTRISDAADPHSQGLFTRTDGVRFWVELWDFRGSTNASPPVPILIYVELW
jgi:hypothetical protein